MEKFKPPESEIQLEIVIEYLQTIARYHFPNEAFKRVTPRTKDKVVGFAKWIFLSDYADEHSGTKISIDALKVIVYQK